MKRTISMLLCLILVAALAVPSFAVDRAKISFSPSDIIESFEAHSPKELAAFKAELSEKGMLEYLLYPEVLSHVYIVSANETPRRIKRGAYDVFGDEDVIMGIKKDNGFVTVAHPETFDGNLVGFDGNVSIFATETFGDPNGVYYRLAFSNKAVFFLNSLSYNARESYMLNLYLSVMDTEEAIGLSYDRLYRSTVSGDVNGDGKVNAADSYSFISCFMSGASDAIPSLCDIDGNGEINLRDNFYIKLLIIGE